MDQGIFLNGKNQIIEMLKYMSSTERERLLANIKHRNPQLAEELHQHSFQFEDLQRMTDVELKSLFHHVTAPIMGIAIRDVSVEFQRRILSLAPREFAENAFDYMKRRLPNEKRDIQRAQSKVISIIVPLLRKSRLS